MKLIKTIRLPVLEHTEMFHELYTLLEEFPDLVIIGEIRDPRDAYASRYSALTSCCMYRNLAYVTIKTYNELPRNMNSETWSLFLLQYE